MYQNFLFDFGSFVVHFFIFYIILFLSNVYYFPRIKSCNTLIIDKSTIEEYLEKILLNLIGLKLIVLQNNFSLEYI